MIHNKRVEKVKYKTGFRARKWMFLLHKKIRKPSIEHVIVKIMLKRKRG